MKFISITLFWVVKGLRLIKTSSAFVSPRPFSVLPNSQTKAAPCSSVLYNQNRRNEFEDDVDDDSPVLVQAVETIVNAASSPTPGAPTVALVFPVALLLVVFTESWPTALTTAVLFSLLAWFGRSVALDEEEEASPSSSYVLLDAIAFFAALGAANLFLPSWDNSTIDLGVIVGVSLAIIAITQVLRDPLPKDSPEERLMDKWDNKFRSSKVNGQSKKEKSLKDSAKGKKK